MTAPNTNPTGASAEVSGAAVAATPGPWVVESHYSISSHGSTCVAFIVGQTSAMQPTNIADVVESYNMTRAEAEANAVLLGAAPELLEALIFLATAHQMQRDHGGAIPAHIMTTAEAAIAKATGAAA